MPALRSELVIALIRSLPKDLRKRLVPVPEIAAKVLERLKPRQRPLLDGARRARSRRSAACGSRPTPGISPRLPAAPEDDASASRTSAARCSPPARTSRALREQVRPTLRAALAARDEEARAHRPDERGRSGRSRRSSRCPAPARRVRAYPSLVDEGDDGRRCARWRAPEAQALHMRAGTRRLLALTIPSPAAPVPGPSSATRRQLALMEAPHASVQAVLEDAATAAISALMAEAGGPVYDEASFDRLRDYVAGHAARRDGADHRRRRADPAGRARGPRSSWTSCTARRWPTCARDVAAADRPARLPRLHHRDRRARGCRTSSATCAAPRGGWSACTEAPPSTATACAAIHELEDLYRQRLQELPRGRGRRRAAPRCRGCSRSCGSAQFAQARRARAARSSARKIRRILDEAAV